MNFSIGSDPEFFMVINKEVVPSTGIVLGNKYNPIVISEKCSVHEDNVALEINVPPSYDEEGFVDTITSAVSDAKSFFKCDFLEKASHFFKKEQLESKSAKEFGCDPDFDAIDFSRNEINTTPKTKLRCCGGHICVGYEDPDKHKNREIVMWLDIILGVPSIIIDNDKNRRKLYGKASAYRDTNFGVEYRVLSNFWVFKEGTIRWVYRSVGEVVNLIHTEKVNENIYLEARNIINSQNKILAKKFTTKYNIKYPNIL